MDPVLEALRKIKAAYGEPREGYDEYLKTCKKLDPMFNPTARPDICIGYCTPDGQWLHELMVQPYYDSRVMKAKKSDVFVASFPKTGTTWTQEISFLVLHNADTELTKVCPLEDRTPFLEMPTIGLKGLEAQPEPRLIKTHLPYELLPKDFLDNKSKIVYIARNPKDTVVSYYNFMKMVGYFAYTGTLEAFLDLFIEGKVAFSSFAENVLSYWNRRNDENVLFLTYEGLQKDILGGIRKVATFLGKELSDEQVITIAKHCSFDSMCKNPMTNYSQGGSTVKAKDSDMSFMRKGKVGDWRNKFSEEMNRKMDAYVAKHFAGTGLEFEYEI